MLYKILTENLAGLSSGLSDVVKNTIGQATIINIDNVADYYFGDSDQEYWEISKDFPNIAPPFEAFWMEYKMPTFINSEGVIKTTPHWVRGMGFGALFLSEEITDEMKAKKLPDKTDCKWSMGAILFSEKHGKIIQPGRFYGQWGIRPDGSLGHYGDKDAVLIGFDPSQLEKLPEDQRPKSAKEITAAGKIFNPMLLAISFLHCRNVNLIQSLPTTNRKGRTPKPPKIKVYTLEIEPMRRVLETEGQSKSTGLKNALHICRGHFKDYRETGLFGKLKGIYWWDSQVRGNIKAGVIKKDYEISSPDK